MPPGLLPCLLVALLLASGICLAQPAGTGYDEPAQQRYRQLSLLLIISEGVQPDFLDYLLQQAETSGSLKTLPPFQVEDFQTPLNRIISQPEVIASAARLFAYANENQAQIRQEMTQLTQDHADLIGALDPDRITEEAIIIRSSLAGSIEFDGAASAAGFASHLDEYQQQTVFLRNMMEYRAFREELAAATDSALRNTVGRLDAYQRLLDDNANLDGFSRRMAAIEFMYLQVTGRSAKPPPIPGEELIDAESQVK